MSESAAQAAAAASNAAAGLESSSRRADAPRTNAHRLQDVPRIVSTTRFPVVQLVVLVLVVLWASATLDGFTSSQSLRATLVIASLLTLAALGQTAVVLIGGLDMAVPGYLTVGAVSSVLLPGEHGWSLWATALLVVAVTGLAGAASGAICHVFKVQPLVVSLGVSSMLTGAMLIVTKADFIGSAPAGLSKLTSTVSTTFGLPIPPVVSIATLGVVLVSLVLARTAVGRRLYATGTNPVAAEGIRIRTGLIRTGTFAVSAAMTGLTGMLVAGFAGGATLSIGDPYFFSGLAAVLVGGTALGSAHGDVLRTALGALTLTVLATILTGMGLGDGDRRVLFGMIIVVVVLIYGREVRTRDRL
jgi:ribose transport system permease protein